MSVYIIFLYHEVRIYVNHNSFWNVFLTIIWRHATLLLLTDCIAFIHIIFFGVYLTKTCSVVWCFKVPIYPESQRLQRHILPGIPDINKNFWPAVSAALFKICLSSKMGKFTHLRTPLTLTMFNIDNYFLFEEEFFKIKLYSCVLQMLQISLKPRHSQQSFAIFCCLNRNHFKQKEKVWNLNCLSFRLLM